MSSGRRRPKRASEVLDVLKSYASKRQTIAYGDLADLVGSGPQNMGKPLAYIEDQICRPQRHPWLTALAVAKGTGRPGPGFKPEGFIVDDHNMEWWFEEIRKVYDHDWSDVDFED